MRVIPILLIALALLSMTPARAEETPTPPLTPPAPDAMTLDRMGSILTTLDPQTRAQGSVFELTIEDVPVLVVTDVRADRMRAMVPIRSSATISPDEWRRLMQANFDSALDARYAVANGRLWSVFIHPLSPLDARQLISGIAQTVNVALTYGTLYSGGAMQFGGGDSAGEQRKLIDRLLEKGQDI